MRDLIGTNLGQYRLDEVIGRGGTATVYKAYQASLDRYVAIKVLHHSHDPRFALRFKREAWLIAQLQHPNILPIYEYGEQDGLLYLVLRYIKNGTTLADRLGEPIEPKAALELIGLLLVALEYAHACGVIHRDIKPANILMPTPAWPVLADFGIAKSTSDDQRLTSTGVIIGTPAYMAPEQALGRPIDARTDLYALGVILYEMLAGRPPFDAPTPVGVLARHVSAPVQPLRSIVPDLPEPIEAIVLCALAKDPAQRYQSAAEMGEALRHAADEIGQLAVPHRARDTTPLQLDLSPPEPPEAAQEPVRSAARWRTHRIASPFTALLIAAALLGGGSGLRWFDLQHAAAQPRVRTQSLAAATATPTAPPASAVTATATPTATPPPTATPAPTATPEPTAPPSPTPPPPTRQPRPTAPPSPTPPPPPPTAMPTEAPPPPETPTAVPTEAGSPPAEAPTAVPTEEPPPPTGAPQNEDRYRSKEKPSEQDAPPAEPPPPAGS